MLREFDNALCLYAATQGVGCFLHLRKYDFVRENVIEYTAASMSPKCKGFNSIFFS